MQNQYNKHNNLRPPYDRFGSPMGGRVRMNCNHCFPEIYYIVQPYVMSLCDELDSFFEGEITEEMFDQWGDNIQRDVLAMHPELTDYVGWHGRMQSVEGLQRDFDRDRDFFDRDRTDRDRTDRDFFDRDRTDRNRDRRGRDRRFPSFRFRRRGLFRDFIDLLLLNELFRRGRIS